MPEGDVTETVGKPLFWQLGFVVRDIEASMRELSGTLGLIWSNVRDARFGDWKLKVVMSKQGPPYFELIEAEPGSPWDASAGSRLDHISYWVDDLSDERGRLEAIGVPVVIDGQAVGLPVNYHLTPKTGLRLEPFDAQYQDRLREDYGLGSLDDALPFPTA